MRALACIVVMLGSSSIAAAEDDLPDFDHVVHWQLEPGIRMGSVLLDGKDIGGVGGMIDAGVRYGRVMAVLDLSQLGIDQNQTESTSRMRLAGNGTPATDGTLDRVGVAGRVYLARAFGPMMVFDGWLSAGVGHETYAWTAGGVLGRNDLMVGFGGTFGLRGEDWHPETRRWWGGMTVAIYLAYAKRDDGVQPVACGGPCDMPTAPSGYDRTVLVDVSFPFGK